MPISCLNCGSTDVRVAGAYNAWLPYSADYFKGDLVGCQACRLHFLHPLPDDNTLKTYYSKVYRSEGASHFVKTPDTFSRSYNPWARAYAFWELLDRHAPGHAVQSVCDVGAGWGYFLLVAKERGVRQPVAVETDEYSVRFLKQKGIRVEEGMLEDLDARKYAGAFDLVTLSHVLEHSTHPADMLARVRHLLKPGGHLVIEIPNADFAANDIRARGNDAPHITFFAKDILRDMLQRGGFEVLSCENAGVALAALHQPAGRKSLSARITALLRAKLLVHLNRRWGNPDMFRYGGNRAYIRALVRKPA
jgi:2-polyprenyl-3-methyl-5-hydroxy-6-metoxy-1,4-benzoquinol methylase